MSKLSFNIPDYLSLKAYRKVTHLEHLTQLEKAVVTLSALTDMPEETIRDLDRTTLAKIYDDVSSRLIEVNPEFYPVFELNGVLYGYSSMSAMRLGEYVDLERLADQPKEYLQEIMAILYRPILKHRFNSFEYNFKQSFKVVTGEAENLFKYYTLEKYKNSERQERAELLSEMPVSFALGALAFFLQVGGVHSYASGIYSRDSNSSNKEKERQIKKMIKRTLLDNIGGGLQLFTTSRLHPSLTSQEIKLSRI